MNTKPSFFGIACRLTAFTFLMAGTASLMQAQQSSPIESNPKAPLFLASNAASTKLAAPSYSIFSTSSSSSSSSSDFDAAPADSARFKLNPDALDSSQPPPRRRYGRPNYADAHSNPDGSPKYTFMVGAGMSTPIGDTHFYQTPSYDFQLGGGRNFNKTVGVMLQFDYDHFGLQGATIANQEYIYNYCTVALNAGGYCAPVGPGSGGITQLDGNNHVWSFTVDPTFTLATEGSLGAYVVVGGGFYHKVTNFTLPQTQQACSLYGCGYYTVFANIDHYTSNAAGVNGGFGLTYKMSKFSNERFFVEGRYVFMANENRPGVTTATVRNSSLTATNLYPANSHRTTFIPITFGLRF